MSDELQFLMDFQKELKEQPNDCQAAPRFWVIGDYRMVPCPDGEEDEYFVVSSSHEVNEEMNALLRRLKDDDDTELSEEALLDFDEIECDITAIEWIKKYYADDAYKVPVREEHYIRPNTMFLLKQDAIDHLYKNRHNYTNEAHTYAMTALRAPKMEKLLQILENYDFSAHQ